MKNETIYPHSKINNAGSQTIYSGGLTKREYFAAMAMQGICANPTTDIKPYGTAIAKVSIEIADELIKQLES